MHNSAHDRGLAHVPRYLDFSNPKDYERALMSFGGYDVLKHFPRILSLLEYSQKCQMKRRERTKNEGLDNKNFGYENIDVPLSVDCSTAELKASLLSTYPERMPTILHCARLYDISESGSAIRLFANTFVAHDEKELLSCLTYDSTKLQPNKIKKFRIEADLNHTFINEELQDELISKSVTQSYAKTLEMQPAVTSMHVNDPRQSKTTGNKIVILYNRAGVISDPYDYAYENVTVGSDQVALHIPCSGSVTLLKGFTPEGIAPNTRENDTIFQLFIRNKTGPISAHLDFSKVYYTIYGQTLNWEFPTEWKSYLTKQDFDSGNNNASVDFHLAMSIRTNTEWGTCDVPITVSSYNSKTDDPANQVVKKLYIKWGCFGEDTRIRVVGGDAAGTPVKNIEIGQSVITAQGTEAQIHNIYSGFEEELIYIETEAGQSIKVSASHPLLTSEGLVRADELTAADVLRTVDGGKRIKALFAVPYCRNVYNLEFAQPQILIANGIFVGDFSQQNHTPSRKALCQPAQHADPRLAEDFANLAQLLAERQQRQ